MTHDTDPKVIERLGAIDAKLEVISTQLFGSEEDHFEMGRIPMLENRVKGIKARIDELAEERARRHGRNTVLSPALRFVGKALWTGITALAGALYGAHFHK